MTKKLNSFHLKIIAIIAMTLNHFGQIFAPYFNPFWWHFFYEFFGKLTFPIMAFLLVEGYKHTSRFNRYVTRLVLFAFLSILPFHFAFKQNTQIYLFNNILFTLSIGLIMLKLIDLFPKFEKQLILISTILTLGSDWNGIGILIIYFFKKYKNYKPLIHLTLIITLLQYLTTMKLISFSLLGILLVIPILKIYNGQKGFSNNLIKYGFYSYYPLHLTILIILKVIYAKL